MPIYIYIGTLIVHKTNHFIFHVMIHANFFLIVSQCIMSYVHIELYFNTWCCCISSSWTESTFFHFNDLKTNERFFHLIHIYCERGHNRHIYWSPPQMEITYERHDGLWQSDWSRYTRINNSKKKKTNKSPSLHIYWRCTEIADYSEIAKDNIIIAFYVFYHPFVSSRWVFFGYGTHQSDLPYQMKGK